MKIQDKGLSDVRLQLEKSKQKLEESVKEMKAVNKELQKLNERPVRTPRKKTKGYLLNELAKLQKEEPSINRLGRLLLVSFLVKEKRAVLQVAINFQTEIVPQGYFSSGLFTFHSSKILEKIKISANLLIQEQKENNFNTLHSLRIQLISIPRANPKQPLLTTSQYERYDFFYKFLVENYNYKNIIEFAKKKHGDDKIFLVVLQVCFVYFAFSKNALLILGE